MRTIIAIFATVILFSNSAEADIWSKMFNVKVVNDTKEDQFEYGYQNGFNDAKNNNGRDGRIAVQKESDMYYNRGYEQGYYEALMKNSDVAVIYEPKAVIIRERMHNPYDEVPHFELFQ